MRPQPLILPPSPVDDARVYQTPRAAPPRRRRSGLRLWGAIACAAAALLLLVQLRLAGRRVVHHMHEPSAGTRSAPANPTSCKGLMHILHGCKAFPDPHTLLRNLRNI